MTITENHQDNVLVVNLSGRLDGLTSPEVDKKFIALAEGDDQVVVVDLSGLEYISSAGLRVLLMAAKKFSSSRKRLVFGSMTDNTKQVFDISGFTSILKVYPSTEAAVAASK